METISGIWNNKYVQKLGILDHCNEILTIENEIKRKKNNNVNISDLEYSFDKELMDLKIMLDKYFEIEYNLKEERLKRFEEKSKEN